MFYNILLILFLTGLTTTAPSDYAKKYVVSLKKGVDSEEFLKRHGLEDRVYTKIPLLNGFGISLDSFQAKKISADSEEVSIFEPDSVMTIANNKQ